MLNFGKVKNMDTFNAAATDKEPSTIRVLFTAILIKNTAYTNDTVIVTAGAEYDSERYVWVSQATHSYVMNPVRLLSYLFRTGGDGGRAPLVVSTSRVPSLFCRVAPDQYMANSTDPFSVCHLLRFSSY